MGKDSCYVKITDAYLSASVEWNSSYYVTVNVTSTGSWRFKLQGTPGDTNNIFAQYGNLTNGGFQGSLNATYVFQMYDRVELKWFEDTFTITQDSGGGGGSGGGDSPNSYYVYYYDRDGTSLGWTNEIEGQYFTVRSGSSATKPTGSSTNDYYTITGDANGGTFSDGKTTASITATITTTTSYSFSSWNTSSSGTGFTYSAGSSYIMPSYDLKLYPIFSSSSSTIPSNHSLSRLPQPNYTGSTTTTLTATFNANGGSVSTTSQSVDVTVTKTFGGWMNSSGTVITSLSSAGTVKAKWNDSYSNATVILPLPTRNGHIFDGWSTSTSGTNLQQAGTQVSISGNTTFYAIWTEKEKPKGGVFIHDGTMWQLVSS